MLFSLSSTGTKMLIIIILMSWSSCYEQRRYPSRYLIPEGYVGWVRVDFGVKDAPVLSTEEGYYIFKFTPTGHIKTSTLLEYGGAKDEFYYYSGNTRRLLESTGYGKGGMIWGGYNSAALGPERKQSYELFFVGTEEEFKNYGLNVEKDKLNNPKAGPINADSTKTK